MDIFRGQSALRLLIGYVLRYWGALISLRN